MRLLLIMAFAVVAVSGCGTIFKTGQGSITTAKDVHRDTEAAKTYTVSANKHLKRGDLDDAQKGYIRALEADPLYGPAHNGMGLVYYQQEKLYLAACEFQKASALLPDRAEPLNNIGLVMMAAMKYPEAIEWFERAIKLDGNNPDIIANLASAYIHTGRKDDRTRQLLSDLVLHGQKPQWVAWAREHLATMGQTAGSQPAGVSQSQPAPDKPALLLQPPGL